MSYDPTQPTPIDVIRGMARDTSNDPETEILQDAEYAAILGRHGVATVAGTDINSSDFYRAAAEALEEVAVAIEGDVTNFTAVGEMSVSWSDRTRSLRDKVKSLIAKAEKLESDASKGFWGPAITVGSNFLTHHRSEGESW